MKFILPILCLVLFPYSVFAAGQGEKISLSQAAAFMGHDMDRQLSARYGHDENSVNGISVIVTTPVDLNNLEESSPVARQMQEEISTWLVRSGYSVQEIRTGKSLLLRPGYGELLLTRNKDLAAVKNAKSAVTLVGTYSVNSRHVTFNLRLVQTGGTEILAMSSINLPVSGEMRAMLGTGSSNSSASAFLIEPSVFSRLP